MQDDAIEKGWEEVRSNDYDLTGLVDHIIEIGRDYHRTEHPSAKPELIEHHRNSGGDSGIANWVIRLNSSYNKTPQQLIDSSTQLLSLSYGELVEYMANNHLDIRESWIEPAKGTSLGSFEQFYNWNCIFHNGEEYELIHMAIILENNPNLRKTWSEVLCKAFQDTR